MLTAKDDKKFPVAPVKQESSFPPSAANVREDLPIPRAESADLLEARCAIDIATHSGPWPFSARAIFRWHFP
jgi:hypothetical protein